jgi:hypothetical protein
MRSLLFIIPVLVYHITVRLIKLIASPLDCGLTHTTDNLVRESLVRRSEEEAAKIDIDGFTFTNAEYVPVLPKEPLAMH